jgi:hypothetical protein
MLWMRAPDFVPSPIADAGNEGNQSPIDAFLLEQTDHVVRSADDC